MEIAFDIASIGKIATFIFVITKKNKLLVIQISVLIFLCRIIDLILEILIIASKHS